MDARALLEDVAEGYRRLKTLAIDARVVSENGDEETGSRSHHRARFLFATPTRLRYETSAGRGSLQLCDGTDLHHSFGMPPGFRSGGGPRVSTVALPPFAQLPHVFKPQHPMGGGDEPFLYHHIADDLLSAERLADDAGYHVVSAQYQPSPHPHLPDGGPVTFWIEPRTKLVMQQRGAQVMRFPTEEVVSRSRYEVSVLAMRVDDPLPEDTFVFTPPAGASVLPRDGCGVTVGGGGGFARVDARAGGVMEHRSSHEWDGDTLIEHSTWKLRGTSVVFERRMRFVAEGAELQVEELAKGPGGDQHARFVVKLR